VNVDIGCNFMPPLKRITRKMVGLSVGDNNVSDTLTGIMTDFVVFLNGLQKFDPEFDFNIEKIVHDLMELPEDHRKQRCISLSESIGIKVKDFLEGYRLKTNVPTPYPFACNHKTLGVMADGKLVPCCHIFDDSFVIGDMNKQTLKEALQKNKARIGELRSFNTLKENICKKCYGAPSKRGIYLRHFAHKLKKVF